MIKQAMKKVNYKSDFDFILDLKDNQGRPIGIPQCDWTLYIYTESCKHKPHIASCRSGELHGCYNDDGRIHVVCDNHGFGVGDLMAELRLDIPNKLYTDGKQNVYTPISLDIALVSGPGDEGEAAQVENTIPVVIINAYELASELGYEGTQEEFYAALTQLPRLVTDVKQAIADGASAVVESVASMRFDRVTGRVSLTIDE